MARRPKREDDVLSRDDLKELQQRRAHLGEPAVEDFYRSAHHKCSPQPRWLSIPRSIQELVQAWKLLRKWEGDLTLSAYAVLRE